MGNYTNRHFPKEFVKKYEFEMQNTLCGIIELCTLFKVLKNPLTQQDTQFPTTTISCKK